MRWTEYRMCACMGLILSTCGVKCTCYVELAKPRLHGPRPDIHRQYSYVPAPVPSQSVNIRFVCDYDYL